METINNGDTICAIATPLGQGGISIIRISGSDAIAVADKIFVGQSGVKLAEKKGYTASFGKVFVQKEPIDSSVAVVFRAPKSYTGEDIVELSCHGGVFLTREILREIVLLGARLATPGEFTMRAYLNGKMNITQAEAVVELINSKSKQGIVAAKSQLDGVLYGKIMGLKKELLDIAGHLAAWADYPDEDIKAVDPETLLASLCGIKDKLDFLLAGYDKGKLYKEGIDTVIIGKPNVGKSSLMNLLVGEEKSIVTEIAGTTRDAIEETVRLGDIILKLSDTAGIHETKDTVERFGVELAKKRLSRASLVLAVFDSSMKLSNEDKQIIESIGDKLAIAIINKADLEQKLHLDLIGNSFKNVVAISAKNGDGLKELEQIIADELHLSDVDGSIGLLANERQRQCAIAAQTGVHQAIDATKTKMTLDAVTISIELAIEALMELTGERITTEIVNQVFSHFCVGK